MIKDPFPLLLPFSRQLRVGLFAKEDGDLRDEDVRKAMNVPSLASLNQVHGERSIVVREGTSRLIEADALATDVPDLALSIGIADCQPILVYEPERHVVGLIHAGWKGLLKGIIPSFFDLLREEWGIRPEETFVAAGPSLCQKHSAFTDPMKELPGIKPSFFDGRNVDLRGIADDQLRKLGVQEHRLERMQDCTACESKTYWSYRRGDREEVKKGSRNFLACALTAL